MRTVLPILLAAAIICYTAIPLILLWIEIPLLRRIHNFAMGRGFTPCAHLRRVPLGMYGETGCPDCGADFGYTGRHTYTKEELEHMWRNWQEHHAKNKGA